MKTKNLIHNFRIIAVTEGISFLILLFIAMPLKYLAGLPLAVKVVGYIHGFLFIAFVMMAWMVKNATNKNFVWFVKAFIASLLPFGTFVLDKSLKKEEFLARLPAEKI